MSDQVYVNPKNLEEFSLQLKTFSATVDKDTDRLLSALGTLGHSWQDASYDQFEAHVRRLAQTLLSFCGEAEKFSAHLAKKAKEAEQIHQENLSG